MPLQFESLSHGKIAFGFFNIETDMVLLNQYFFFAEDFCRNISWATERIEGRYETTWEVYQIKHEDIGNLMGAIHGIDHRGFIGEIYKLYPFPKQQEDFKQNPEGFQTRPLMESLIRKFALKMNLRFVMDQTSQQVAIGEYYFDKPSFHDLIRYIWIGGFPRWKDDIRPDYVVAMKEKIKESRNSLFHGCNLTPDEN
jgi:hypothetical protein